MLINSRHWNLYRRNQLILFLSEDTLWVLSSRHQFWIPCACQLRHFSTNTNAINDELAFSALGWRTVWSAAKCGAARVVERSSRTDKGQDSTRVILYCGYCSKSNRASKRVGKRVVVTVSPLCPPSLGVDLFINHSKWDGITYTVLPYVDSNQYPKVASKLNYSLATLNTCPLKAFDHTKNFKMPNQNHQIRNVVKVHATNVTYCSDIFVGFCQVLWRRSLPLPVAWHNMKIDKKTFRIRHMQRYLATQCVPETGLLTAARCRS